ncbi:hypothetical protein EHS25_001650 [Saitozyma podzolica]|uniref:SH3 domain-containing protein n=1 Tax=Saitozyma podzolica TaxID=1890683 RepID=A0A427YGS4_9TREE|nr:hypothetical protein EHS25_001650 [Saitozyma podzolica]
MDTSTERTAASDAATPDQAASGMSHETNVPALGLVLAPAPATAADTAGVSSSAQPSQTSHPPQPPSEHELRSEPITPSHPSTSSIPNTVLPSPSPSRSPTFVPSILPRDASSSINTTTAAATLARPRPSRASSGYQSTRPAPASPAPSSRRGSSQLASPALSLAVSRDRASSNASSAAGSAISSRPGSQFGPPGSDRSINTLPTSLSSSTASASASGSGTGTGGTSSSIIARRFSSSSSGRTSRARAASSSKSKSRPRSSLGTSFLSASAAEPDDADGAAFVDSETSSAVPSPARLQASPNVAGTSVPEEPSATALTDKTTNSLSASQSQSQSQSTSQATGDLRVVIIIRDYAYPPNDDRHRGILPIPPAPANEDDGLRWRHDGLGGSSAFGFGRGLGESGGGSSSNVDSGESGAKNYRRWSGLGLLSWRGFLGRGSKTSRNADESTGDADAEADDDDDDDIPITVEPEDDYAFESSSEADEDDDEDRGGAGGRDAGGDGGDTPRVGEGEDPHELDLEEGEVVDVKGRGGGEGWVVATKLVGGEGVGGSAEGKGEKKKGKEGLVPESYLEKVDESEAERIANAGFSSRTGNVHPIEEEAERDSEGHDGEASHEVGKEGISGLDLGLGGDGTEPGTGTDGGSATAQSAQGEAGGHIDVPGEKGAKSDSDGSAPLALPLPIPLHLPVLPVPEPGPEHLHKNNTTAHAGEDQSKLEAQS